MDSVETILKNLILGLVGLWLVKNALDRIFSELSFLGYFGYNPFRDIDERTQEAVINEN